ncbi:MAG: protein TolR [Hyphomonadaceae bacterium]
MAMMIGGKSGRRGKRRRPMADINVTPMVDVMLVLLVVFMITAPMLATGVAVTLPKTAAEQLQTEKERPLVVTVDKDSKIYVGMEKEPIPLKELAPMLMALAENNLEKRVYVRGDEAVPYGAVVSVLALLQRAGFKNAGLPVDANAANRILSEGG